MATNGGGAYLVDALQRRVVERFSTESDATHQLPANGVLTYRRDANGVDWFGLNRYGAAHTYRNEPLFHIYRLGEFTTLGLQVRSVLQDGPRRLIAADDGLYVANEDNGQITHLDSKQLGGAHLLGKMQIFGGYYYIGSFDGGLLCVDRKTLRPVPLEPSLRHLGVVSVGTMAVAPDHKLWIGTSDGLYITDGKGNTQRYTEQNSRLFGGNVNSILFMPEGRVWVAGAKGACMWDEASQTFSNDMFPADFFHQQRLSYIHQAGNGLLYFLSENHLCHTSPDLKHYGQRTLPAPLDREWLTSLIDDRQGHIWITTENGLLSCNTDFSQMAHFGNGEALNCQQILGQLTQDSTRLLWLGTSNGLVWTDPASLESWRQRTRFPIVVYDVKTDGQPLGFTKETALNNQHQLQLTWNMKSQLLSLKPILEDFARPQGRLYEWQLDEGEWQGLTDKQDLLLGSLGLGNHTLAIRLAGAPGTMRVYRLSVVPSGAAWTELAILLAALGLAVWARRKYSRRTNELKTEMGEMETALAEQEKELQEAEIMESNPVSDNSPQISEAGKTGKYARVRVDSEEAAQVMSQLRARIEQEKLYTRPDLKLSDLARMQGISASKLSLIFSQYEGEGYYEFINAYRLQEFKRLIAAGAHRQYTITALSEQCGFKKSNFFLTFRRIEGCTPNEYLKRQGVKI